MNIPPVALTPRSASCVVQAGCPTVCVVLECEQAVQLCVLHWYEQVQNLSGGELQRVAITLCLGQPAEIYLIDEPSAYLDSEQRILTAKVRLLSLL